MEKLCSKWSRLTAWSAVALIAGGAVTFIVNAGLTPLLEPNAAYAKTAASMIFLWRQVLSAIAAMFILAGLIGLYLHQANSAGWFGLTAFIVSLVGSVMLFANEWSQVFFVRPLALSYPDVLTKLEASKELDLFDLGAIIALATFTLGWILLAVSILRARVFSRRGPIALIAGFFAVPVLTGLLPHPAGVIVGNALLGFGWAILGHELFHKGSSLAAPLQSVKP